MKFWKPADATSKLLWQKDYLALKNFPINTLFTSSGRPWIFSVQRIIITYCGALKKQYIKSTMNWSDHWSSRFLRNAKDDTELENWKQNLKRGDILFLRDFPRSQRRCLFSPGQTCADLRNARKAGDDTKNCQSLEGMGHRHSEWTAEYQNPTDAPGDGGLRWDLLHDDRRVQLRRRDLHLVERAPDRLGNSAESNPSNDRRIFKGTAGIRL